MPAQTFIGGISSYTGSTMLGLLGNRLTQSISSQLDPVLLYPKYDANSVHRSGVPDLGAGVNAYVHGRLPKNILAYLFNLNNLHWGGNGDNGLQRFTNQVIDYTIDAGIPRLSLEQLIYCYYTNLISEADFKKWTSQLKMKEGQFDILCNLNYAKFDMQTIINNNFRGTWDRVESIERIQKLAGCKVDHAAQILDNALFIPTPGDLITFAVRGVYNEDEVKQFGLDDEYNEIKDILPWAKAIGITESTSVGTGQNKVTRNIMKDYWRAHWQLMSPTQGFEALHRIRANRLDRFNQNVPGITPFDFSQLNTLLKAQDYVPTQRKWLAAISYNPLGRIDLRRLYQDDIIDDKELGEQYQDIGYVKTDADLLLQWSQKQKKDKKDKERKKQIRDSFGTLIKQIYAAYKDGAINRSIAFNRLDSLEVDADEISGHLDAIDIEINRNRIKTYIKMVKDEFFMGLYDGVTARNNLIEGGVDDTRADQYVILWQRQLSMPRKAANIATVMQWYTRLLIDADNVKQRLHNLGVSNADTLIYIQKSEQDIRKQIAIEDAKLERSERQKANDIKRLENEIKAAHREAVSLLRSYSPISAIKSWYLNGEMTEDEVINRMTMLDIPLEETLRYLDLWNKGG